ncbi:hypothetical protein D3C85_637500 [compost metagenome]
MAVMPRALLVILGRRQPDLQTVHRETLVPQRFRRALDVCNRTTSGHPADITGSDYLIRAKAVLVLDLTFEQIRERRQTDVRVLSDIHTFARRINRLEHVVEKHERPDAAAFG